MNPDQRAEYVREIQELRDLVLSLWGYAQLQGIEHHAEDGDQCARALVSLTQSQIGSWRHNDGTGSEA